jgi:hypothetical protein
VAHATAARPWRISESAPPIGAIDRTERARYRRERSAGAIARIASASSSTPVRIAASSSVA